MVLAYRRQNEESFLEALVQVFQYFGGVPKRVIFDNAKVAVKDGFGAHARKQAGYAALSAHYGFEAVFCNPASGNEKGLVEGLVGYIRRNVCVPVPKAETASRQENQNKRRLKAAGFPYLKTMEEFDCSQLNDAVSPLFLQELASCQFIQNRQNVIMIGNPGRGKTHLAIALGLKACTQGYNVLFKNHVC